MSSIRTVEQGFAWIESFHALERAGYSARQHRLARMRRLLAAFADPHLACPVIHVAGSKGKGSTAALIASALDAAGMRCGLYTSPHVESYRERVQVLDGGLTDANAVRVFGLIHAYVESIRRDLPPAELPTVFELLTLYGFLCFRAARCDAAVIEVGIGGRTDATNLVRPRASVITRIDLEHTELLGRTLRAIAGEKGGIIRSGIPVFVGAQEPEAMTTLERIAELRGAPLFRADTLTEVRSTRTAGVGTEASLIVSGEEQIDVRLRLTGEVQAYNAALAALTLRTTFPQFPERAIATGFSRAFLPGRSEIVASSPSLLLDGAHTRRSIALLCDTARRICANRARRLVVFGAVSGKDHEGMLRELASTFSRIIIARPGTFKNSDTAALFALGLSLGGRCDLREDPIAALDLARETLAAGLGRAPAREGLIVVTGSFYLVGEVRARLRREGFFDEDHHDENTAPIEANDDRTSG
ncbi:MAG: bifunctional folylpolyglutamate synthase/dihydrofolate synthase [Spirochaetota bacterium]